MWCDVEPWLSTRVGLHAFTRTLSFSKQPACEKGHTAIHSFVPKRFQLRILTVHVYPICIYNHVYVCVCATQGHVLTSPNLWGSCFLGSKAATQLWDIPPVCPLRWHSASGRSKSLADQGVGARSVEEISMRCVLFSWGEPLIFGFFFTRPALKQWQSPGTLNTWWNPSVARPTCRQSSA